MSNSKSPTVLSYGTSETEIALPALAIVGVKLLGLYSLLNAITYLSYLPTASNFPAGATWRVLGFALPGACYLAAGLLLLLCARWLVAHVLQMRDGPVPTLRGSEHFQAMAYAIVGAYVALNGTATLISTVVYVIQLESLANSGQVVARPLAQIALGLLLFLRARGLASLWHRMRYGGVRVREAE